MKSIICTLVTLLLVMVLSGCGQSGPLYVPGDPSSIQAPAETPDGDENAEEKSDDENGKDDPRQ
jgi:predicted small lipoprotein YifL